MPKGNDDSKHSEEDDFNEMEDDPYAIPTEDKYGSNNKEEVDTDTQFSKFIEDKWAGDTNESADDAKVTVSENKKQVQGKKDLTLELGTAGICGLLFVRNFVEGGMLGMAFGGIKGALNGYQTGANKLPGFGKMVYAEAAFNGRSLGLWLGTYRASKVFFMRTRQVEDQLNTFLGGFCAGSMYMLHTRSPVQIVASGLSSGAMLSMMGYLGGSL